MKVLLKNKGGKQVEFSPAAAEYMTQHGWAKVAKEKPESKSKSKPSEADK